MSQIAASVTASPPDGFSHHFLHAETLFLVFVVFEHAGNVCSCSPTAVTTYDQLLTQPIFQSQHLSFSLWLSGFHGNHFNEHLVISPFIVKSQSIKMDNLSHAHTRMHTPFMCSAPIPRISVFRMISSCKALTFIQLETHCHPKDIKWCFESMIWFSFYDSGSLY